MDAWMEDNVLFVLTTTVPVLSRLGPFVHQLLLPSPDLSGFVLLWAELRLGWVGEVIGDGRCVDSADCWQMMGWWSGGISMHETTYVGVQVCTQEELLYFKGGPNNDPSEVVVVVDVFLTPSSGWTITPPGVLCYVRLKHDTHRTFVQRLRVIRGEIEGEAKDQVVLAVFARNNSSLQPIFLDNKDSNEVEADDMDVSAENTATPLMSDLIEAVRTPLHPLLVKNDKTVVAVLRGNQ